MDNRFDYKLRWNTGGQEKSKEDAEPSTLIPFSSRLSHQDYALAKGIHDSLKVIAEALVKLANPPHAVTAPQVVVLPPGSTGITVTDPGHSVNCIKWTLGQGPHCVCPSCEAERFNEYNRRVGVAPV